MSEILTLTIHPRVVVNGRAGVPQARADVFTLPTGYALSYLYVRLIEVPLIGSGVPFVIEEGAVVGGVWEGSGIFYTQHTAETAPPAGTYKIDDGTRVSGIVQLGYSAGNAGRTIRVSYSGLGSQVAAEDINELSNGLNTAMEYVFNGNVTVPGKLVVTGDIEINGSINETTVDTLKVTDTTIVLNSAGGAITEAGMRVDGSGQATAPNIKWHTATGRWEVVGGLAVSDGINIAAAAIPALTMENVGKVFLDPADDQFKGIIANSGNPIYVVLG